MDPNACMSRIERAYSSHDWREVIAACQDLSHWVTSGGFLPDCLADRPLTLAEKRKDFWDMMEWYQSQAYAMRDYQENPRNNPMSMVD